jgi:hypothetical protein
MPCDIGYKSYSRIRIPAPQPQKFKSKVKAPKVDAELMARLGQDDPQFVEWLNELDIAPLLQAALERALAATDGGSVEFSVAKNGDLIAEAEYKNDRARKKIEKAVAAVSARWQMEVLGVIAQLLDFSVVISAAGSSFTLEGEKENETGVHEYIRIVNEPSGASIRFEHYRSPEALQKDKDKLLALAQKLGVKIAVVDTEDGGQPVPQGTVHRHFLPEKE